MTRTLATIAATAMLAVPSTALAQTAPTQDAYGGGGVLSDTSTGGGGTARGTGATGNVPTAASAPSANAGGSLPFTGLDVAFLAAGGIVMLGVGMGLRRISRSPGTN